MDKASIVGDAISYVQDLQKQVKDIQAEISQLESDVMHKDSPFVDGNSVLTDADLEFASFEMSSTSSPLSKPGRKIILEVSGLSFIPTFSFSFFIFASFDEQNDPFPLHYIKNSISNVRLQLDVAKVEESIFHIRIYCKKGPGVLVDLTKALESLHLDFQNANLTSFDGQIIKTAIIKVLKILI